MSLLTHIPIFSFLLSSLCISPQLLMMALLLLVQAVTDAAPTKQLEVVDTVEVEVATKNNLGCLVPSKSLMPK